ncbi:MAG: hypothetical protein ACMUIE_02585 [Thermoplasmatota archaeon]
MGAAGRRAALTILSVMMAASSIPIGSSSGEPAEFEMIPTDLYLYPGSLSPMGPGDNEAIISIPNGTVTGYESDLLGLPAGSRTWRDVGIGGFSSDMLHFSIDISGPFVFTIWVKGSMEGIESDFEFSLFSEGSDEPFASARIYNISIGTEPEEITAESDMFDRGRGQLEGMEKIHFGLKARSTGNASLLAGSGYHPSRITFFSNALRLLSIDQEEGSVRFQYRDAFFIPWIQMSFSVSINGTRLSDHDARSYLDATNQSRVIELPHSCNSTTISVDVSLSYGEGGDDFLCLRKTFSAEEEPEADDEDELELMPQKEAPLFLPLVLLGMILALFIKKRKLSSSKD